VLFLTKPLGTGFVGTAIKFDRAPAALATQAIESMRTLNRPAADALQRLPAGAVHACTDITGFGLAGHGAEMARASRVTLAIAASRLPLFDGVLDIARANRSGGLGANQEHFGDAIRLGRGVAAELEWILYDPQTSGGLLIAAAADAADEVEHALAAAHVPAPRIGRARKAIDGIDVLVDA
jgi:selenide,water dikinase